MSDGFLQVPLGEAARPIERPEAPITGTLYRQIGVRLWGEGAYERETIDGSQTKYGTLSQVKANDIIVNKIWARNGSVAVVQANLAGCYCSGEFPTFAPIAERLHPRWFHWLTKTKGFWEQCDEKSRGTSGKNRIKPEQFLRVQIPLPPLPEQRRIVARIDELAGKVEEAKGLRREAVETAEVISVSTSRQVFEQRYLEDNQVCLGEIADIRSGVTLGRALAGDVVRLPYLRVANVQDGHLNLAVIKEVEVYAHEAQKWRLLPGDVLLTEGGDWDKLGRGTVWHDEIAGCIHQNHIFRVRVDQDRFEPEFMTALFASPQGKAYFQSASKQTTNLASINQRQLKAFPVPEPPVDEQVRIVAYLDGLQAKVDALKTLQGETAAELAALLPSVLDRAFTGRL